jgi:glutamyl-tRNA reductase
MDSLDVVPTIKELRQKITDIVQSEIDRTLNGTELSDAERAAVGRMIPSLVNKILHHPTALLKGSGCHGDQAIYLDITRKLFKLDNG